MSHLRTIESCVFTDSQSFVLPISCVTRVHISWKFVICTHILRDCCASAIACTQASYANFLRSCLRSWSWCQRADGSGLSAHEFVLFRCQPFFAGRTTLVAAVGCPAAMCNSISSRCAFLLPISAAQRELRSHKSMFCRLLSHNQCNL
jgi:hypothetical protein